MSSVIDLVLVSCELRYRQRDAQSARRPVALLQLHTADSQHGDAETPADGGVSVTVLDSDLALRLMEAWTEYCQGERAQPVVQFEVRSLLFHWEPSLESEP